MKYPFRHAKLRDYEGDLSQRWYVEFWIWDIIANKLVRKRDYDMNREKSIEARRAKGLAIAAKINEALEQGYVFDPNAKEEKDKTPHNSYMAAAITGDATLKKALDYFIKSKQLENGKRSEQAYNTLRNRLFEYLHIISNKSIALKYVNHTFIEGFCNYLRYEHDIRHNATMNSYIKMMKALFNFYVEREVLVKNPSKRIKYLQSTTSDKHLPYTDRQAKHIMQHLKAHDEQLYLFCNFIYFSFIRPKELRYLKVSHLQKSIIKVPSLTKHGEKTVRHSKNKKTGYVKMLPGLAKLIQESNILSCDPEHFIFSTEGRPAKNPVSANFFNIRYRKVLDQLGFSADHTMYSWKHTGAINLYEVTHDMKLIQMQCRHADIKTTDRYLRGLTLIGNFDQVDMPGF